MNPPNWFDRLDLFALDGGRPQAPQPPLEIDAATAARREREPEVASQPAVANGPRPAQERRALSLRDWPDATTLSNLVDGRLLDVTDS